MKPLLVFLFVLNFLLSSQAQPTTFILLRHAEKENDGTKNPDLTEAGKNRAVSLVNLLIKTKIDAIYSTSFKRTENTVAPLANAHMLTLGIYDGSRVEEIDKMIKNFSGGTIVLCGHSNTTPAMINYLTGHPNEYKTFEDDDYGNLVIVTVVERGKSTNVTWLRY